MRATRNPQRRGILLPLSPQSRGKAELIVPEERAGSLPDVSPGIGRSPVRAPRPGGIHVPLPSNSLLETHSPENRSRHHESLPAGTVEPPGPVTQHAPRQELADMIPSLPPADRKAASARAHQDFSRFVPGSRRPAESSVTSVSAEDASTAEDVQTTRPLIVELPPRRRRLEELLSDPHQDSGRTQRILPSSVESRRHGESSSFAQGSELYELRHPESQRSRLPSSSRRIIDFTDHRFRSRWSDHSDRRSSGVETVPRRTPVRPRATSNGARTLSVPNTNRFRQLSYEQPDMSESPVRAPGNGDTESAVECSVGVFRKRPGDCHRAGCPSYASIVQGRYGRYDRLTGSPRTRLRSDVRNARELSFQQSLPVPGAIARAESVCVMVACSES